MRLRKKMIDHVAKTVGQSLVDKGLLELDVPTETFVAEISRVITADLLVEDRSNDEVKEILRTHMQHSTAAISITPACLPWSNGKLVPGTRLDSVSRL